MITVLTYFTFHVMSRWGIKNPLLIGCTNEVFVNLVVVSGTFLLVFLLRPEEFLRFACDVDPDNLNPLEFVPATLIYSGILSNSQIVSNECVLPSDPVKSEWATGFALFILEEISYDNGYCERFYDSHE